ncbi:MAG: lactate racemase domain-containing protein, partial [Pseudomonadota bacterium]
VVVIVEDMTRASPKKLVLEALFEALGVCSIPEENISVVLALGTHRAPSPEELREVYGEASVDRYEFISHDCYAGDLVPVGKLKTGREVKINRRVYEADFRVGVGSIFPHPMNGFGGGGKILFPGVADFESIREHHLAYSFRPGSELGRLEANPFHEEICAMARSGKLNFIINSVLDHNDHLYDVVCGDPIEAHRSGARICRDIISRKFEKKADVTVISAFPYNEGPQIMKPLAPASMITREGGCIILCADVKGKLPDQMLEGFEGFHRKYGGDLHRGVIENFEKGRLIFENRPIEFNMAGGQSLLAQHEFHIILVSEDIPKEAAEKIGFRFAEDLDQAFKMAAGMVPPGPEVHVIPSGGVILPVV